MNRISSGMKKNRPLTSLRRFAAAVGLAKSNNVSASDILLNTDAFDETYYLRTNPDVAAAGVDPYQHYISYGKKEGRHGAPEYKSGGSADLVENHEPFDADFYLEFNEDVAAAGVNPYEHYLAYGKAEGRVPLRPQQTSLDEQGKLGSVNDEALSISADSFVVGLSRSDELFDETFYLSNNADVAAAGIDPYQHFLMYGRAEGRFGWAKAMYDVAKPFAVHREPFDEDFYLEFNRDVAASGVDPYEHYIAHGKLEGRIAVRPKLTWRGDFKSLNPESETVLIVSHEASRTGAPVLSLNIARELRKRYNVVSMLLKTGSIEASFSDASNIVVEPAIGANGVAVAGSLIDQLLAQQKINFAIVNSIESRAVLPALAKHHVPTVTLIHEFAAYTRPRTAFREVALWSTDMVFSAPVIRQDAIDAYPDIEHCVSHIIPQGRCVALTSTQDEDDHSMEDARITCALRPPSAPDDTIVVLGAGFVQLRKGVDLFLKCAARVMRSARTRPVRFVWVGKGYDPEYDLEYSVYLADQLRRAGLTEHVSFVGETSSIEAAYSTADLMLISSRLDPLPNVAIDAMAHGVPVICFDRTTGVADVLKANGLGDDCVAAYLDTSDMADKVLRFLDSDELRKSVGGRLLRIVQEQFDMAHYVDQLVALATAAKTRVCQEQLDINDIEASALLKLEFMAPPWLKIDSRELLVQDYARTWASGVRRRKPFPGFHPGIYQEHLDVSAGDPFAQYIRAGQPEGPWKYEVILPSNPAEDELVLPDQARIALHLHVYYPDLLPDIMRRLLVNRIRPDLFISVPSVEAADVVRSLLETYDGTVVELKVVPNRGRDIGPFLTLFGKTFLDKYDIVGHLHTKKTLDIADASMAEAWRNFILEHLVGGNVRMADTILARMFADSSIGMVCADDPYVVDWGKNRRYADDISMRLALSHLPDHFLFPVGTMFWARTQALRSCFELGLEWEDYPAEPLPYDGSILHALERLFGLCAATSPYRLVTSHVPGFVR